MRRLWLPMILTLSLAGCKSSEVQEGTQAEASTNYAAEYSKGKEARAWIGSGTNHMFEASDETCKEVIEELYKLGATEVRVTDGDKLDESSQGEIAATLMAKLPADPAKRKALFEFEKENAEDADTNQKRDYIEIVFD